ncbi:MAG: tRNA (adenosine(37)-N6)-dimethylallyltransferase MiaA [Muribaculaceae bacterium]|nr:tRNA (adenosine(37)-N6)-dimethylallyltransferase MiaA [Muribaculaceae bacterium]
MATKSKLFSQLKDSRPRLIVITGPTGVGKTAAAIALARQLGCHIIGADSRQLYREMPVTTAMPTAAELAAVPHHMVACRSVTEPCSAAAYADEVLDMLPRVFAAGHGQAILCGGSMMYIDAVTRGIDAVPDIRPEVRQAVLDDYERLGLEAMLDELRRLDPRHYAVVDRRNPRRVLRAVEVCRQTGSPYSSLLTGCEAPRDFDIVKFALNLPRPELFERINRRVDAMVEAGMVDEVRRLLPLRGLSTLDTVGVREIFAAFDGTMTLPEAVERVKKNTRVYAKKQLTWLRRDPSVRWLDAHSALCI